MAVLDYHTVQVVRKGLKDREQTMAGIVLRLAAIAICFSPTTTRASPSGRGPLAWDQQRQSVHERRAQEVDADRVKAETRTKKIGIDWYTDDYFAEQPWEEFVPKTGPPNFRSKTHSCWSSAA